MSSIPAEPSDDILYQPQGQVLPSRSGRCGPTGRSSTPWPSVTSGPSTSRPRRVSCGRCSARWPPWPSSWCVLPGEDVRQPKACHMPLYAFVGILCWSFFAAALGTGGSRCSPTRRCWPRPSSRGSASPWRPWASTRSSTVISWIPLTILFVIFGRAPAVATLWVPMFIVIEMLFAAGVTLAISSIIIQMRDLVQVLPIITSLGLFATPVIWPFSKIPTRTHIAGGRHIHPIVVNGHHHRRPTGGGVHRQPPAHLRLLQSAGPGHRQRPDAPCCSVTSPHWKLIGVAALGSLLYLAVRVPDLQAAGGELCRHCLTGPSRSSTSGRSSGPTRPCPSSTTR